jgi:hypothetical protein
MSDSPLRRATVSVELHDALDDYGEWTAMKDEDNDRIVFVASDSDTEADVHTAARKAIRTLVDP